MIRWTTDAIQAFVNSHSWYHKIDLGHGIVTPGHNFEPIWNNIRATRDHIAYEGKAVLDIGTWDGLWAFEAEALGAATVIATDVHASVVLEKFLACREILGKSSLPFFNVSPYKLVDGLMPYLHGFPVEPFPDKTAYIKTRLFDVVQHLGVLYHLRDPLLSLSQARSVMKTGGILILETAASPDDAGARMQFNCTAADTRQIYDDVTTWWAPSPTCLHEMLRATMFEPLLETQNIYGDRMAIAARAIGRAAARPDLVTELERDYRNPGFASHLVD